MFTLENVHHLNRVGFLLPLKYYNVAHNTIIYPVNCRPNIQQALKRENFQFHRTCSLDVSKENNVIGKQTFLIFRSFEESESRSTISLSTSSCSFFHMASNTPHVDQRETELRSTEQQTDLSCWYAPGVCSPGSDEPSMLRAQIADSLTFSSPPSSVMQNNGRSLSILGSVCAMLLAKQGSTRKEVSDISSRQSMNICRICFGGESSERLVRPCACRGTVAAVHRACLERWLLQACTSYCELCRHHYTVTRKHKWSLVRSVWEWARSGRGRALLADAWRAAALGGASLLGTARALHAADAVLRAGARGGGGAALAANLFSSVLIGIIGALNGLLTTWILLKIQEHQASWRTWRDGTVHVRVALDEPTPTPILSPTATPSSTPIPSPTPSDDSFITVVCDGPEATVERSTNIADPFMVTPYEPDP